MQVRTLLWINFAIAFGLMAWAWVFLPFAHGVACGAALNCPPLSAEERILQASLPGLLVAVVAMIGARLTRTRPGASRAILLLCPMALAAWVSVGLARSLA